MWIVAGGLVVALLAAGGVFAFVGLRADPLLTEIAKGDWECLVIDESESGYTQYPMDNSTANRNFDVADAGGLGPIDRSDDYQGYRMLPIRVTDDEAMVNWGFVRAFYDWRFAEDSGLTFELTSVEQIGESGQWEPSSFWGSSGGDETPTMVIPDLVDDPAPQDVDALYEPDGNVVRPSAWGDFPLSLSYTEGIAQIGMEALYSGTARWGVCRKDQFLLDRTEEWYLDLANEQGWSQPPSIYPTEE